MRIVKRACSIALAGGVVALVLGSWATPAAAKPLQRQHFHDATTEVDEHFCDDLTVRIDTDVDGSFLLNPHGSDGLAYGVENVHGTQSFTNLANNKTFTNVFSTVQKDLTVTDNRDGTLTILVLAAGSSKVYGPDGKLLFSDPGQTRFELLIDDAGTPTDPGDDVELEFLGVVKGSTGRNDLQGRDFCADIHQFIG